MLQEFVKGFVAADLYVVHAGPTRLTLKLPTAGDSKVPPPPVFYVFEIIIKIVLLPDRQSSGRKLFRKILVHSGTLPVIF